jgi:hypothetical protein
MKHLQTYSLFEAQTLTESEYRNLDKNYIMDNFKKAPNNKELYDAKEADFSDLPWFQALKGAFPTFALERVRKKKNGGYSWFFTGPKPERMRISSTREITRPQTSFEVYRPGDISDPSVEQAKIIVNKDFLTFTNEVQIYLNDKESWNQIFKLLYFAQFSSLTTDPGRSLNHTMKLFSTDLENFYKTGDLGIVGVKKDCNPYGGHYKSEVNMLKNLPYGIFDDIKKGFIKGIEERPGEMQYAISQCQIPNSSAETGFGTARLYPENEVLNFYNLMKEEGYVPPAGFDEKTRKISDLHQALGDIGL